MPTPPSPEPRQIHVGNHLVPSGLREAAQNVHQDGQECRVAVREFLRWFEAERRGKRVVARIRIGLKLAKLTTLPDFESAWIDGAIRLGPVSLTAPKPKAGGAESQGPAPIAKDLVYKVADPAHQLSRLEAANRSPISVAPDASVEQAVTLMLIHDFSQLPVMTSPWEVKGVISWKTIASRSHLGNQCKVVRDCMDVHHEMRTNQSIFDAIKVTSVHDFVLVRDSDRRISGILTGYDISDQFSRLTEPFLLLGDIETQIRNLIEPKFETAELQAAKDPTDEVREVEGVGDLTFGEYLQLLENPENWARLELPLDRKTFVQGLGKIKDIRNEVMHFDPDGVSDEGLVALREFAKFLTDLSNGMK